MMKKWKKALAALLAGSMLLGLLAACDNAEKPDDSKAPDATGTPVVVSEEYPIEPEELGSGEVKWSEEKTADGWMKVTNNGGETLGYSPDSGVKLIQVSGLAFKDLNKNGKLDLYEDWRQDANARAADLASQLPADMILGLMIHDSLSSVEADGSDAKTLYGESFKGKIDVGVRTALHRSKDSVSTMVTWNNTMQAYAESKDFGIPVNISANPGSVSDYTWVDNLALAATFDPSLILNVSDVQAKQFRAVGIPTLLGPQIDVAGEPRWSRVKSTYGEDPALSRDMTNAAISGFQSTYDENGADLGWGNDSVVAMMKHWPGDGFAEGGRESHNDSGKFNVYPGNNFETSLIPFVDGGLKLDSLTKQAEAVMTSYSIAWSDDGSLGELVGSAFSEYKMNLLRDAYDYDGLVCTDWGVSCALPVDFETPWGLEDLSKEERQYLAIKAGVDQLGGDSNPMPYDAYNMLVEDLGEDAALQRIQESARRITRSFFLVGLFDNSYIISSEANATINDDVSRELSREVQLKSVIMLKNDGGIIKAESNNERPTVYVPMQYTNARGGGGSWNVPVDINTLSQYFNVVTDTVGEPTGEAGQDGKPTMSEKDIIRASKADLAGCDYALVFVTGPATAYGNGYIAESGEYVPISLQYGEYTATSLYVRQESIAGDKITVNVDSPYGPIEQEEKENRSYYGKTAVSSNASSLDLILSVSENMPEGAGVIVAVNASNPMVFSEFEDKVDAILMGFGVDNDIFLDIVTGKVEPSGLLPIQMPTSMEAVEKQLEDVPRDMECHVDASGNTYDFGFGLNWSGVIQDARTAKYCVPALTEPAAKPVG